MPVTRRQFLMRVAQAGGFQAAFATMQSLGLLAMPEPYAGPPVLPNNSGEGIRVVILGGGIAGLVSAYELRKAGYKCTVLEARDRPGGRNWTIRNGTRVVFTDGTEQNCAFEPDNYMNAGPARLPSVHKAILGYCQELGVPLEVEVNLSRSSLLQNDDAFGGHPVQQRQAVNDTRGHVSELLAKAIHQHALDQEMTAQDQERMLEFLRIYGDLQPDYRYTGSERSGFVRMPGAGRITEEIQPPLAMDSLLNANFWRDMMYSEMFDMQPTMFQPVGGMDRIPYAFARKLSGVVQYNSPVQEIRQSSSGVRIAYKNAVTGEARSIEADYCICALPLTILKNIPNDFSPAVQLAIKDTAYDSAYKIGWESRRFWEQESNIYGGLSFVVDQPVELLWYPSAKLFSERGVLIAGYSIENGTAFGKLPTMQAKLEASRSAVDRLHPRRAQELSKPIYISWGRIPYNLGSWVSRGPGYVPGHVSTYYQTAYKEFLAPDGPVYFAGDHTSHIIGWQEGAALSAHRAIHMISERVQDARLAGKKTNPRSSGGAADEESTN